MSETFELSADDNSAWRLAPAAPARLDDAWRAVTARLGPELAARAFGGAGLGLAQPAE